jgi:hypothetical protein
MLVAQKRARILEIPVNHRRRRGGVSKVSGTFKGTILATFRIAVTFFRVAFSLRSACIEKNLPAYFIGRPVVKSSMTARVLRRR